MKFKSRKDILFSTIIIGICVFIITLVVVDIVNGDMQRDEYWVLPIILMALGLLLWFFFGTNYELNEKEFIYRSGPFNGKISLHRIGEIVKGKTQWVGFRPATARKGLIIKYDTYNEIYISPKTNEVFIEKILELKDDIVITS